MNFQDNEEKKILISRIPQKYPFVFVDKILKKTKDVFSTSINPYFLKQYFYKQGCNSKKYPVSLLIEQAAQTMYLHGYYLGKENLFWDYTYKPIGVLLSIENVYNYDLNIDYDDTLVTTTYLIKYKLKFIFVDVVIKSELKNTIIFKGRFKGMYIKSDLIKNISLKKKFNINQENNNCLKFYDKKNGLDIFSSTYWFLDGHFPGFPCIPGCFLIEGLIQSSCQKKYPKKIIKVKFKQLATPENTYKYINENIDGTKTFKIINLKNKDVCVEGVIEL